MEKELSSTVSALFKTDKCSPLIVYIILVVITGVTLFNTNGLMKKLHNHKIDNIFTLCLNPNSSKRKVYLKQIEDFVIPLTKLKLPNVYDYLIILVNNAHRTKHISLESVNEKAG